MKKDQSSTSKTGFCVCEQLSKDINPGTEYVLKIRLSYTNHNDSADSFPRTYFEWPHLDTNLVSFIGSSENKYTILKSLPLFKNII